MSELTQRVFEVLDDGGFPGAVFPLHIVGRHETRLVGGVADPPPGLRVIQEPKAFVLLDVQLLVLLGHVVKLGDDDHLFRHVALRGLETRVDVRVCRERGSNLKTSFNLQF